MNELLFFISIVGAFFGVVVAFRVFGKAGLFAWVAFAPIMANILTAKQVTIFGLDVTMGTILFASIFLASDILNEKHGKKEASKAAWLAFASVCGYIIIANISLLYVPNAFDFSQESMSQLFGTSIRISVVSALMFLLANLADVAIYNYIKGKGEKKMWLRSNVSTIIANCLENFLFVILAFWGLMPFKDLLMIALGTSVLEVIASVCGTPFLYIATKKFKTK